MKRAAVLPITGLRVLSPISADKRHGSPSNDGIRSHLLTILQSEGFVHAERMKRFLEFVVEETLADRADGLCEYSIGVTVFKRGESFEPGLDPIVRNEARRLRHKLLEYYQRSGVDDDIVIDIPKGGYVPVFRPKQPRQITKTAARYCLAIKLIRIADGAEILNTEHEFTLS